MIQTLSFNCWQSRNAAPISSTESLNLGIEQSTYGKKRKNVSQLTFIKVPFAGLRSSRPKICRPKFYRAQQHSHIPIAHFSRLFRFTKVSSSLKERGRFHIYPACFVSWWLKERDILHTLLIKLCFSASSDITKKFGRHTLHTRCLSGDLTGYHCVTS